MRKNIRRTHEMEYVIQKYHRAATVVETFEYRFQDMQGSMKQHSSIYDDHFKEINKELQVNIPATLSEQQRELNSWKRLLDMNKTELEELSVRQISDSRSIMKKVKND